METFYTTHEFYKNGKIAKTICMKGLEGITDLELSKSLQKKMLIEAGVEPMEIIKNQIIFIPLNPEFESAKTTYKKY